MVIFHSYVSLSEGNVHHNSPTWKVWPPIFPCAGRTPLKSLAIWGELPKSNSHHDSDVAIWGGYNSCRYIPMHWHMSIVTSFIPHYCWFISQLFAHWPIIVDLNQIYWLYPQSHCWWLRSLMLQVKSPLYQVPSPPLAETHPILFDCSWGADGNLRVEYRSNDLWCMQVESITRWIQVHATMN
jgi:hypothetical protein